MKIAYVGPLWDGGTCRMRMRALQDLGHEVFAIDTAAVSLQSGWKSILERLLSKVGYPPDSTGVNAKICEIVQRERPDCLWIDKGLTIKPTTLLYVREGLPRTFLVSYSPDDMLQPHNQSHSYLQTIPIYDIHFTTKTYNVDELRTLGAKRAIFIGNAYDPHTHRPIVVSETDRLILGGQVGFIGAFEMERTQQMLALAQAGIPVRVWGWGSWSRWQGKHPDLKIECRPLWGDAYAKAICSFEINLGFLRKINRDQQTTRSVEIPACGGFILAERTEEHLELFEEGKEAEFFGSIEELIEKVQFYLKHEDLRKKIALAGRKRCLRSGYDYHSRMRWMLEQVKSLGGGYRHQQDRHRLGSARASVHRVSADITQTTRVCGTY